MAAPTDDPLAVFNQMLSEQSPGQSAPTQPASAGSPPQSDDPMAVFQTMIQAKQAGTNPAAVPGAPQTGSQTPAPTAAPSGPLSNAPDDTGASALAKGAGTAAIKGLAMIPGLPGDVRSLRDMLGARLYSAIAGGTPQQALAGWNAWKSQHPFVSGALSAIDPLASVPTSAQIYDPVLAQTGEYEATTPVGKAAMAAAEMAIPTAVTGGLEGGAAAALKAGAMGAASGAIANTGEQLGHPYLGLVGAIAAPEAASRIAGALAPLTAAGRAAEADKTLAAMASDPQAALASSAPTELVPGSMPTLAEQTLDPGLIQAQKIAETQTRGMPGGFAEQLGAQQAEQNAARTAALETMSPPDAIQTAPAQLFRDRLAAVNAENEAAISQAQQAAEKGAAAIPEAVPAEVSGGQLRDALGSAYNAARENVRSAYSAVDPTGTMAVVATPIQEAAARTVSDMGPLAAPMSGEEAAIFNAATHLPPVLKFGDLQDLEQRITAAVAQEKRLAGAATPVTARLGTLKSAIQDAMSNAIENQAAYEQKAVAAGSLAPEATMAARLQQEGAAAPQGAQAAAPELAPNMTPQDAEAYANAKAAHAQMAQTFRSGPVGKSLASAGYEGQYKMPESGLPAAAFPGGYKGYETTSAFLNAADQHPLAVGAMKDMATSRLRDMMKGAPTLDPDVLNAWKGKYASSLRAIDEAAPGFSSSFDTAAQATQKLKEAQSQANAALSEAKQGAAAQLLGAHSPDEVRNVVGGLLADKFGPSKIKELLSKTGGDQEALKGLRAAGVDWMVNKFTNAGVVGGKNVISGAKLGKFVNENTDSIRALYGDAGLKNMQAIAADLRRSEEAFTAMKVKGGSDTASNFITWLGKLKTHAPDQVINMAMIFDAFQRFGSGHWAALAADVGMYGLKAFIGNLRARGIQNMTDMVHEGLLNPEVGKAMMQRGLDARGAFNQTAASKMLKALLAVKPVQRAAGGRVGDHEAVADRLIRAAAQAKSMISQTTKPMLEMPDHHIVKALAIANRSI